MGVRGNELIAQTLKARGVDTSRLVVSASAHVVTPDDRTLDKVNERLLGSRKMGTTGRGTGQTYAGKRASSGSRGQDRLGEGTPAKKDEAAPECMNRDRATA